MLSAKVGDLRLFDTLAKIRKVRDQNKFKQR